MPVPEPITVKKDGITLGAIRPTPGAGGGVPSLGHMGCMGEIVLEIKLGLCGKGWREEWMLSRQSPMSEASELYYLHN